MCVHTCVHVHTVYECVHMSACMCMCVYLLKLPICIRGIGSLSSKPSPPGTLIPSSMLKDPFSSA
jgi:hypothetical protein